MWQGSVAMPHNMHLVHTFMNSFCLCNGVAFIRQPSGGFLVPFCGVHDLSLCLSCLWGCCCACCARKINTCYPCLYLMLLCWSFLMYFWSSRAKCRTTFCCSLCMLLIILPFQFWALLACAIRFPWLCDLLLGTARPMPVIMPYCHCYNLFPLFQAAPFPGLTLVLRVSCW